MDTAHSTNFNRHIFGEFNDKFCSPILQKLVLEIERKRKFFRELQKRREMAEKQLQLEIAELERALL